MTRLRAEIGPSVTENGIMTAGRSPSAGKLGRIARAIQQGKRTLSSKFEQSVAIKLSAKMPFFAGHWASTSVVAGTPVRLILGAVCSLEDALDAAQIQR
jgi:hypothetical protein